MREFFEGSWTLLDAFADAYDVLRRTYRNEYVYKNELISYASSTFARDAVPISELNISWFQGRVDFVVAECDIAHAFELKTSLDSLARIESQSELGLQVFGSVSVVCAPEWTDRVRRRVSSAVGVLELQHEGSILVAQSATDNRDAVDNDAVFRCLRQVEYQETIARHFGTLPSRLTNIQREHHCREAFQLRLRASATMPYLRSCAVDLTQIGTFGPRMCHFPFANFGAPRRRSIGIACLTRTLFRGLSDTSVFRQRCTGWLIIRFSKGSPANLTR